jgi:A/G-specific adenine glycosylase
MLSFESLSNTPVDRTFFVKWYRQNGRKFPWRQASLNPFHQLITEMLLRKTKAENVARLWPKIIATFPDAESLFSTPKHTVARRLRRLGFGNQKADALRKASRWLLEHHYGKVPDTYEDLMNIPHVGAYSAGAVMCFAFSQRFEIVDVNVQRFFSRYYGLETKTDVRRNPFIKEIARDWLPRTARACKEHNYGLLDFAGVICKSDKPKCLECPLRASCSWAQNVAGRC